MDSTFKKQKEHKLNRVKQHKEFLLKREKRMEAKGKAPAMVAKDVKAHNDLVPKLKESSVEDDKVTLSEDSGEKALTPEDLINKVLMADEGDDKVTKKEEWEESVFRPSILANPPAGWSIDNETQNQESDVFLETLSSQETEHARAPEDVHLSYQDQWVCGNRVCGNQVVPEVDDKYIASSSQDEWVSSKAGTITSYFICLGKTRWEQGAHEPSKCRRLMTSKQWDKRKHDTQEAWVPQQKWYCKCSSRYKAGWGQVVIIEEPDGTVSYVRAECPSWDTEDIRAMKTEATVSAERVKELYDKIRSINPSDIVGMDADGCKYIKKYEDFLAMPFFSLEELLTLTSTFSGRL